MTIELSNNDTTIVIVDDNGDHLDIELHSVGGDLYAAVFSTVMAGEPSGVPVGIDRDDLIGLTRALIKHLGVDKVVDYRFPDPSTFAINAFPDGETISTLRVNIDPHASDADPVRFILPTAESHIRTKVDQLRVGDSFIPTWGGDARVWRVLKLWRYTPHAGIDRGVPMMGMAVEHRNGTTMTATTMHVNRHADVRLVNPEVTE